MAIKKREPHNPWVVGGPEYHPAVMDLYRDKAFRDGFADVPYGALYDQAQSLYATFKGFDSHHRAARFNRISILTICAARVLIAADKLAELVNAPTNAVELFPMLQEMRAWALARSEEAIAEAEGV